MRRAAYTENNAITVPSTAPARSCIAVCARVRYRCAIVRGTSAAVAIVDIELFAQPVYARTYVATNAVTEACPEGMPYCSAPLYRSNAYRGSAPSGRGSAINVLEPLHHKHVERSKHYENTASINHVW